MSKKGGALPHKTPNWIDPSREIYFITICCATRTANQLAHPKIAAALFDTIRFRQQQNLWWPHLVLLMPDHLHALVSFPPSANIANAISSWKRWTAKNNKIDWQNNYFEHRLRHDESLQEKSNYILENPIRAGLVTSIHDWPYSYFADRAQSW